MLTASQIYRLYALLTGICIHVLYIRQRHAFIWGPFTLKVANFNMIDIWICNSLTSRRVWRWSQGGLFDLLLVTELLELCILEDTGMLHRGLGHVWIIGCFCNFEVRFGFVILNVAHHVEVILEVTQTAWAFVFVGGTNLWLVLILIGDFRALCLHYVVVAVLLHLFFVHEWPIVNFHARDASCSRCLLGTSLGRVGWNIRRYM